MTLPSISIIVPVYNVGAYVEDCIRSVMRQTYTGAMECIIVDDCGTDDSMETVERLVAEYKGPISFQILRHARNRGLSAARNTGMDAAGGDYLFFLDSDDELTDDCIETLSRPLELEWYDVVTGDFDRLEVLPDGSTQVIVSRFQLEIPDNTLFTQPSILRTYRVRWNTMAWNKLVKTSFIRDNGLTFKEGLIHEDNLWGFQVACLAATLYALKKVTYHYKKRNGSIINNPFVREERAEALVVCIKEMRAFVQTHHIDAPETFPFFSNFFDIVLDSHSSSRSEYVSMYKELRPYITASLSGSYRKNRFNIKGYLHDLHFFMPSCMAPFWQFFYYYRFRPWAFSRINKRNDASL